MRMLLPKLNSLEVKVTIAIAVIAGSEKNRTSHLASFSARKNRDELTRVSRGNTNGRVYSRLNSSQVAALRLGLTRAEAWKFRSHELTVCANLTLLGITISAVPRIGHRKSDDLMGPHTGRV